MRGGFLLLMVLLAGALGAWAIVSPQHADLAFWPNGPHAPLPIGIVSGVAFAVGIALAIAAALATQSVPDRATIAVCVALYLVMLIASAATRGDRVLLGTMLAVPAIVAVVIGLGWALYAALMAGNPHVWLYVLVGGASLVLLLSVVLRDPLPVQMALALGLGVGTLRTAHTALGLIRDNQPIEMRTRAGGLGGGAGGWTMSPTAGVLLLVAILAAATIGVAGLGRPPAPPANAGTPPATTEKPPHAPPAATEKL